jgi:hypothetical protein
MLAGDAMGAVSPGIPKDHVTQLKALADYAGLVETGTFLGATTEWASQVFPAVHTVEASPELFERAKARLGARSNVTQHQGRSPDVLRQLVPTLTGRWLFWLDAHWSAGETFGEGDECPLLSELAVILRSGPHPILIDDARCFVAPPGAPHDWRQWPTIDAIAVAAREHSGASASLTIVDDVIFVLPRDLHEPWCEYLHHRASTTAPKRSIGRWFRRRAR